MRTISLSKLVSEIEKAEINKIEKLSGHLDARWCDSFDYLLKRKMTYQQDGKTFIVANLLECYDSGCLKPNFRLSDAITLETANGQKYIMLENGAYKPMKLPKGWKSIHDAQKEFYTTYMKLLNKNLDGIAPDAKLVENLHKYLENSNIQILTHYLSKFITYCDIEKSVNDISCNYKFNSNVLDNLHSWQKVFTGDTKLRRNLCDIKTRRTNIDLYELIINEVTPEKLFDATLKHKISKFDRVKTLNTFVPGSFENIARLFNFRLNENTISYMEKPLYTTQSVISDVKNIFEATKKLLNEIFMNEHGMLLANIELLERQNRAKHEHPRYYWYINGKCHHSDNYDDLMEAIMNCAIAEHISYQRLVPPFNPITRIIFDSHTVYTRPKNLKDLSNN